jgi:hypothetical protein
MGNQFEEKHYGFFRGIVTQTNDPERRGRVKIAIPEFIPQYARDTGMPNDTYAARFVGGSNVNSVMDANALQKFNSVLKWAEQVSPLIGGGTAGVFDAKNKVATVGEGHRGVLREPLGEESITPSGESVAPKAVMSVNATPGGFDQGSNTGMCDVYNNSIAPSPISNASKGIFSVPRVGSQVWLFFENGSLDHPVYIGYVFDKSDWNSVMNPQGSNPSPHYPGSAENVQDGEPYFFSGQTVLNSKAGSIELTETDDFESIKISHHSGSHLQFSNHLVSEVSTENRTKVTYGDEHHTVKGNLAVTVHGDVHYTYRGDIHITYGDQNNKSLYDEWVEKAGPAYAHSSQFSQKERTIKDPTLTGATTKSGPNANYKHPDKLTLTQSNWTNFLRGKNPNSYKQIIPHQYGPIKVSLS